MALCHWCSERHYSSLFCSEAIADEWYLLVRFSLCVVSNFHSPFNQFFFKPLETAKRKNQAFPFPRIVSILSGKAKLPNSNDGQQTLLLLL